ncbi:TPA: hypothetical protein ACHVGM_002022, partial [Streptococcus suis]
LWLNYYYQNQQNLVVLESNALRTSNHLSLSSDEFSDILTKIGKNNDNFWLVQKIENGDKDVLNIFANNWDNLHFPHKTGELLYKNNDSKALIGYSIKTIYEENKEYVIFEGRKYEVIGKLGMLANSPLSRTILVSDKKLLAHEGELSLNGELNDPNFQNHTKPGDNIGVERIFSLSQFAFLLNASTVTFVGLSIIFWIHFLIRKNNKIYQTYHLLGKNWVSIYIKELFFLLSANICILTTFTFLFKLLGERQMMLPHHLAMVLIEVISFTFLFYRGRANEK